MTAMGRAGGWHGLARSLALFAVLIQFTLPFGVALAADFAQQADRPAVIDCYSGAVDPKGTVRGHSCVLPVGCCLAPIFALAGIVPSQGSVIGYWSVWQVDTGLVLHALDTHRPPVRGPPGHLL